MECAVTPCAFFFLAGEGFLAVACTWGTGACFSFFLGLPLPPVGGVLRAANAAFTATLVELVGGVAFGLADLRFAGIFDFMAEE
jgi:hypothetical protein